MTNKKILTPIDLRWVNNEIDIKLKKNSDRFDVGIPERGQIIRIFPKDEEIDGDYDFKVWYKYPSEDNDKVKRVFIVVDINKLRNIKVPSIPTPHIRRYGKNVFEIDPEFYDECQLYKEISDNDPFFDGLETIEFKQFKKFKDQMLKYKKEKKKEPYFMGKLTDEFIESLKQ